MTLMDIDKVAEELEQLITIVFTGENVYSYDRAMFKLETLHSDINILLEHDCEIRR